MKTSSEWEGVFQQISAETVPDWLEVEKAEGPLVEELEKEEDSDRFELLSPSAAAEKKGVFEIFPTLSFESASSEEDDQLRTSESLAHKVQNLENRFRSLQAN